MAKCVLLVEGEPGLLVNLTDRLAGEGWIDAPEASSLEVVRELKQRGLEVPVLMLKPRADTPRSEKASDAYQFGSLRIDLAKSEVERDGAPLTITGKQFHLLRYFVEHAGRTITRAELLDEVWGERGQRSTRTVDVHVAWLRKKLEPNPRFPRYITTIYGLGYRFAAATKTQPRPA